MYKLNLKFVGGSETVITLTSPHRLIPDNNRPHALVYMDGENMHNIPFTSLLDFWFKAEDYNACEQEMCKTCKVTKKEG